MNKNPTTDYSEVSVSEIRQQLNYAQVICEELFNSFAPEKAVCRCKCNRNIIATKLSMVLDFIFEAKSWCALLEMNRGFAEKLNNEEEEI
ncbi:MAG: hypothetical protein IKW12_04135 [Clostridia bacterium]|nr:hypothetical protein [Clostridia bacterium]